MAGPVGLKMERVCGIQSCRKAERLALKRSGSKAGKSGKVGGVLDAWLEPASVYRRHFGHGLMLSVAALLHCDNFAGMLDSPMLR
jgi:hypothetical protein